MDGKVGKKHLWTAENSARYIATNITEVARYSRDLFTGSQCVCALENKACTGTYANCSSFHNFIIAFHAVGVRLEVRSESDVRARLEARMENKVKVCLCEERDRRTCASARFTSKLPFSLTSRQCEFNVAY